MKAVAVWMGGYKSVLDDGRGHSVIVDLPTEDDGTNTGTSSLELCVMSLAGCISAIFKIVADKRKFTYKAFKVELDADKPEGSPTITSVKGVMEVVTEREEKEAQTVLRLTMGICPAGVLFHNAGVKIDWVLTVKKP